MDPTREPAADPGAERRRPAPLVPFEGQDVLPYANLRAPQPAPAAPSLAARVLAFAAIVAAGLFGGLIGWGTADLLAGDAVWSAVGGLTGAVVGAVGVGVVASLTLRAMNEWTSVRHPEAER